LLSHNLWDNDEIRNIEHWYLKEDGGDVTKTIAVKHASKQAHLVQRIDGLFGFLIITDNKYSGLTDCSDF
jgi:hypothetical protein